MIRDIDYYKQEWEKIVEDAHNNLQSLCPLLEDEVIIVMDEYIKDIEKKLEQLT